MAGTNMAARFQAATKNANATLLLLRVEYWSRQKNIGHDVDGVWWLVNSIEEWADETGLTKHQVKEALVTLRGGHLIETTMARWHGKYVLHVRTTQRVNTVLSGGSVPNGTNGQCQMARPYIYRSNTRSYSRGT